jgi:hypothetical protein
MPAHLRFTLVGMCALGMAAAAHAQACYSLYSPLDKLVYQSSEPPVDLSQAISAAVQARYPGHHLVVLSSSSCPRVDERPDVVRGAVEGVGRSPAQSPARAVPAARRY